MDTKSHRQSTVIAAIPANNTKVTKLSDDNKKTATTDCLTHNDIAAIQVTKINNTEVTKLSDDNKKAATTDCLTHNDIEKFYQLIVKSAADLQQPYVRMLVMIRDNFIVYLYRRAGGIIILKANLKILKDQINILNNKNFFDGHLSKKQIELLGEWILNLNTNNFTSEEEAALIEALENIKALFASLHKPIPLLPKTMQTGREAYENKLIHMNPAKFSACMEHQLFIEGLKNFNDENYDRAIHCFREVIEVNLENALSLFGTNLIPAYQNIGQSWINQGILFLGKNQIEQALAKFFAAKRILVIIHANLPTQENNKNLNLLEHNLLFATNVSRNNANKHFGQAAKLIRINQFKPAIIEVQKAILELKKIPTTYFSDLDKQSVIQLEDQIFAAQQASIFHSKQQADKFISEGNYAKAIEKLKEAIKKANKFFLRQNNILHRIAIEKIQHRLKLALEGIPDKIRINAITLRQRSFVQARINKLPQAKKTLDQVIINISLIDQKKRKPSDNQLIKDVRIELERLNQQEKLAKASQRLFTHPHNKPKPQPDTGLVTHKRVLIPHKR